MSFASEIAADALSLLTEFGEAITFTRTTPGAYDPSTASTAAGSDATFTGYGYPEDYTNFNIDGVFVRQGDVRLWANAVSTLPAPGDKVTLSGTDYHVINVNRITVSGTDVLYECQLRK